MRKLLRLLRRLFLLVLVFVVALFMWNTMRYHSLQIPVEAISAYPISEEVNMHLQAAVQLPTVSLPGRIDTIAAKKMNQLLSSQYPLVDSLLEKINIAALSRVYKWPGKKSNLTPVLLMGHTDVVPADSSQYQDWTHPPFSGAISEDGYIWGRGTLDDKIAVIGIMEAVEHLLKENFWPERTIYLAFGHDEEIGGEAGAKTIANYFEEQGITFEYVMDEGQLILEKALPGLEKPLAMIGVAEKGYVTLQLTAELAQGGHSSMPPDETAPVILSEAINALRKNPFPARIDGATAGLLDYVGPELSMPNKLVFANRNLLGAVLKSQFSKSPATNALIRTTIAPTVLRAGYKDNVIPTTATALINFRILPGDDVESVKAYVANVVNDERVKISLNKSEMGQNPSAVSATNAYGFELIQKSIQQVFPEVVVAPALVIGATDGRHFQKVSDQVYRFLPVQLAHEDLGRIHGLNERISTTNFHQAIRFYRQLILNSCAGN